ncbi:unnamed protein product [Alopecurus aequalis]
MKRHRRHADRLSALPDETLQRILCYLVSDEAVRTSALSRRWRDVHAAVPVVHLVDHKKGDWYRPRYQDAPPVCFNQKVTGAFLCKAPGTPICTLCLDVCAAPSGLIDQWIVSALYFGAEEIDVKLGYSHERRRLCPFGSSAKASADFVHYQWNDKFLKTQHHLFGCQTLRCLRLANWTLDLPRSLDMSSLETLCLTRIMDRYGLLPQLLSNCPCLVNLTLQECPSIREISVESAHLRSFAMICCHHSGHVKLRSACLQSLHYKGELPSEYFFRIADYRGIEMLTIEICEDLAKRKSPEVAPVTTLISRCHKLTYLHLSLRPSMAYDSRLFADAVHRLPIRHLGLEGCLRDDHAVRSVAILLRDTKNLKELSLFPLDPRPQKEELFSISDSESDTEPEEESDYGVDYSSQVTDSLWEMYIKCLDHKLRRINMVNYKGQQLERILAKFLLNRCENLKEFSVNLGSSRCKDEIARELRSWRSNRRTRVTIN